MDQVWNVLSLNLNAHIYFNNLNMWFEETSKVRHPDFFHRCWLIACAASLLHSLFFRFIPREAYPQACRASVLSRPLDGG